MTVYVLAALAAIAVGLLLWVWLRAFQTVRIATWEEGALYIDEGFDRMLAPGRHRVFRLGRKLRVVRVSKAETWTRIGPVDTVTADSLPVRMNATVVHHVTDAEGSLKSHGTFAASEIQVRVSQALLALAAATRLEDLLARTKDFDALLTEAAQGPTASAEITHVVLGQVVLPPEVRRMLTEVERARLESLASLERARGEQAALRSLANAARMLKDNPDLLNLRLLQAVGSAGRGATLVLGEGALKLG